MDTLFSMKVFQQIAELGSFIAASEKLDISKAMTSKHIKHLEEHLGVRLINRTSRRISLTNEGKIYFERCNEIINDLEETEASLKSSNASPKGVLKVAVPNWFQFRHFTNGVKKYQEKYPDVMIDFSLNDRMVDLVEEGIDIALRVTNEPHSNLIARRICKVNFFITGNKTYLDKYGRPKNPYDLKEHKYISQTSTKMKNSLPLIYENKEISIEMKQIISTNSTALIAQMAASGVGLGLLPEYLISEEPLKNELEIVLPEYTINMNVYLFAVYSSRKFLSPKVRTFIDFMAQWFKNQ